MNRKLLGLSSLIVALAMLFTGCSGNRAIITPLPDDAPADASSYTSSDATLQSEGYYAPNTVVEGDAPMLFPAPASLDEIREEQQQAMMDANYQPASIYTNIPKGDINIGLVVGDGMLLNPYRCPYVDMLNLNNLVYESLVTLDENQQPQPQLADRWEVVDGTWTFYLRTDVTFQDGSILCSDDVVQSFYELKRNPSCYWYQSASALIEDVSAKNESTVTVKGRNGFSGFMLLYAMTFPIVQRNSHENMCPIGTGPYLITQFDGSAVQLVVNPVWWKRGTNLVPTITGVCYPTVRDAVNMLGQEYGVDALASEYPTMTVNRTLSDRISVDYVTTTYECIIPNLNKAILKDFKVREALMYAIDRATLADTVYAGMVKESEVPVVPGSWLYEPQAAKYNYNPERALKILIDDGWADIAGDGILQKEINGKYERLSLRLFTDDRGTTNTRSEAAYALADQLRLVGIELVITANGEGSLQKTLDDGGYDLALVAFELSIIPNLGFLLASTGNTNYMRYKDNEMDNLLRQAVLADDEAKLQSAMSKIQIKIVDDLPIFGLFFRTGIVTSKKPLRGLRGLRRGYALNGLATATLDTGDD